MMPRHCAICQLIPFTSDALCPLFTKSPKMSTKFGIDDKQLDKVPKKEALTLAR